MGDDNTITFFDGFSLHPRIGRGFWTNASLLEFSSAFPHGVTELNGAEASINISQKKDENAKRSRRVGELVFLYYHGTTDDHLNADDLPLADDDPIKDLINFDSIREAKSHLLFTEWRWPSFPAVFRFKNADFIQPFFSLGIGGFHVRTKVDQARSDIKTVIEYGALVTSSMQIRLLEYRRGPFAVSMENSVRMVAGEAFGIFGDVGIRFTYRK